MEREDVVVLGGGISGLTVALELDRSGKKVLVTDKAPVLGGHAAGLPCKATERCLKCNDCLVEDVLRQFKGQASARFMTHTVVTDIKQRKEFFLIDLATGPCFIDWERCINCGACYDACKSSRGQAIIKAPSINIHPFYGIAREYCTCLAEDKEPVCIKACPEGAVKIMDSPITTTIETHGIVVATGYEPYELPSSNRYGYGHLTNVITTVELDQMLREQGMVTRPSDGQVPHKVAFVQCVGSRDRQINREYCSRVCCGYSLRMALRMLYTSSTMDITVFYMDLQNFGKDFEKYYAEVSGKIRLIRALPGDVDRGGRGKVLVNYFSDDMKTNVVEDFDMVVLTVGLSPRKENITLAEKLGLGIDIDGFLVPRGSEGLRGVVPAGTTKGPMDVPECIADAKRAALEMNRCLEE